MRLPVLVAAAALAALVLAGPASPHGGVPGYTSTITAVRPAQPGVTITVSGGDDRLRLENTSGRELVILGYDGEPYLRFGPDGVFRNTRSPATYLNDDRYGQVQLPAEADPKAEPQWEQVGRADDAYEWHDHRIHWMSPEAPPQVRRAPDEPHHVFDWEVPGTAGGESFVVAGSLDYAPPAGGGSVIPYVAAPIAAVLIALGVLAWRRAKRPAATTGKASR